MLVKTFGAAVHGIDAILVTIEVATDIGIGYAIVGLPDTAVRESYDRVRSALKMIECEAPRQRVIINMSPADIRKEGSAYDLPIAIGLASIQGVINAADLNSTLIMGELALDGSVLPVKGALPMAIMAREQGFKRMIVPQANATEAAVVNNLDVYGVKHLSEVVGLINHTVSLAPTIVNTREEFEKAGESFDFDFSEVKGQENVKRALEVACAGGHNILLVGPPGAGKSMMAKRLPSILPPLTLGEALETTKIHSVAGKLGKDSMLMTVRPFRSPHHTVSPVALVGGGSNPMPGEISLAHNGVLFMDEFPEFSRTVLEVMRQPLEDRKISISRARYSIDYPAGFMLVASMNPCPCGYYTHPTRPCSCAPAMVQRYLSRISGPLLDRIDIQVEILPVGFDELTSTAEAESSATIRQRVVNARKIQERRFANEPGVHCNAQMNSRLLKKYAPTSPEVSDLLKKALNRYQMSARAYDRIMKVARTIADLDNSPEITTAHMHEAVSYRNLDRASWGSSINK
ncbi:MAG: YifB family Mg chelatase-like AAA ATPase [Bacteroides sp.]|nr:YifB family Mg chelatase-like AAA ATPase [Bacteroides sp.]MDE5809150.1 YifB family Mg chelatase-like AAA ATPase [Muribaculaceae bacterium]